MVADYSRSRSTVNKLITTYGRPITLVNDQGPLDPSSPLGPPAARIEVPNIMGVFVRPSGYVKLGESYNVDPGLWPEAEKIVLVLPSLIYNFAKFTRVVDTDGLAYKIFDVEELKPGPIPILLYLGLKQ